MRPIQACLVQAALNATNDLKQMLLRRAVCALLMGLAISASTQAGSAALSVKVLGNHLVDANNGTLQLRGVNVSVLEGLFNWNTSNYWAGANLGAYPFWNTIKAWKINTVRLPLNEAAWLAHTAQGYTVVDRNGATQQPDLPGNYQAVVKQAVADATAAGLYVILDLHWSAPGNLAPTDQDQLPDMDHTVTFWTQVATAFKGNPAVIFDLFNEPYAASWDGIPAGANSWQVLRDGTTLSKYSSSSGHYNVAYTWRSAGMQTLLNAVRATGSTNVCMIGGINGAGDLSGWLAYKPTDPANQIAASWHAYGVSAHTAPVVSSEGILAAGIPVIIGEMGDASANGTVGAPDTTYLSQWVDANSASMFGWAWDVWPQADGTPSPILALIKDAAGTPTDGYGATYRAWTLKHK